MTLRFYQESGFAAVGDRPPTADGCLDWLVWHFTTWANLEQVAAAGRLLCDRAAKGAEPVGDANIKQGRMNRLVALPAEAGYPPNVTVGDHVPFYFAPRSPMLLKVLSRRAQYAGDHAGLVMLGTVIRSVVESGGSWCVADRNAGSPLVQFSQDLGNLGSFIDFDLMKRYRWSNTPDDPDRQTRRAAEFLVLREVPVTMVTQVVTSTSAGVSRARQILQNVGGIRQYEVQPSFLYQ